MEAYQVNEYSIHKEESSKFLVLIENPPPTPPHLSRYIFARAQPPIDASQDITNAVARHENGVTTMTFTRPLSSNDRNDLSLESCRFFLYGWGGSADTTTRTIGYHPSTPIVSPDRICLPASTECPGVWCVCVVGLRNFLVD